MNDANTAESNLLPGRIEATEMVLKYVLQMADALDPGLRFGFREQAYEQERKLNVLREQARRLLHSDKAEAVLVSAGK